jgi:hypothetical protein
LTKETTIQTIFKKNIALVLLASTSPALLSATQDRTSEATATQAVEVNLAEKTKLQKAVNISGAFLRGVARGAATGIPTGRAEPVLRFDNNFDQLIALLFDNGQVRTLSEAIAGTIDDTDAGTLTEEITAAFVHATLVFGIGIHKDYHSIKKDLLNFFTVFTNRLVKGLDTRKAEGVRKYALLAAIGITESINFKALSEYDTINEFFTYVFRPLVGVTAIGRTLLVDKIINAREASGRCTNAQEIKRTRTILNGTLGFVMSATANVLNLELNKSIIPQKQQSGSGTQGSGRQNYVPLDIADFQPVFRSGATNPAFKHDQARFGYGHAEQYLNGGKMRWHKMTANRIKKGEPVLVWNDITNRWDQQRWN